MQNQKVKKITKTQKHKSKMVKKQALTNTNELLQYAYH